MIKVEISTKKKKNYRFSQTEKFYQFGAGVKMPISFDQKVFLEMSSDSQCKWKVTCQGNDEILVTCIMINENNCNYSPLFVFCERVKAKNARPNRKWLMCCSP